jgi:hypothetical protein
VSISRREWRLRISGMVAKKFDLMGFGSGGRWFHILEFQCFKNRDVLAGM